MPADYQVSLQVAVIFAILLGGMLLLGLVVGGIYFVCVNNVSDLLLFLCSKFLSLLLKLFACSQASLLLCCSAPAEKKIIFSWCFRQRFCHNVSGVRPLLPSNRFDL